MLRFVSLFGCKPRFRSFSSSPCIEVSHLTDENSGITSLVINSHHLTKEILNSLRSLITRFQQNSNTRCILLSNFNAILTDVTDIKHASAYFTEMSKRTIPMVTSFKDRISGLTLELAMSGDVRIFHESVWIEPMSELSLSVDPLTHRLVSLHQRDPRADRRTRAYQLVKNKAFLGANDALLFGLADVCVPMDQDCYQAGLEICRATTTESMAYSGPTPNQALFPGFQFSMPDVEMPHSFNFQSVSPFYTPLPPQAIDNSMTPAIELDSQSAITLTEQFDTTQGMQEEDTGLYERQQLCTMKGAAIRSLWTSFQRVATNLSSLVAEERKRTPNDVQESLHLWPLFHQTASSLTSFYEEAINIYGRGLDQGIEYGRIVERRELVNKSKKYRKFKKETQQYPDHPTSATGEYDEQKCSQPSSPCPNCGYNIPKPSSPLPGQILSMKTRPQNHGMSPSVQMNEQNRKRASSLNYDEMPMEVSITKKTKFL